MISQEALRAALLAQHNPKEYGKRHGVDADAMMTQEQLQLAYRAGLYTPGKPMTVQQIAMAKRLGIIPETLGDPVR